MGPHDKVVSKFYRLKLAGELRRFLEALPVRNLQESQMGSNVYMAQGELRVGSTYYPVGIRVWLQHEKILVSVKAPEGRIDVEGQFDPDKTALAVRTAALKTAS